MKTLLLVVLVVLSLSEGLAQEPTTPRRRLGTLGAFIDDAEAIEPGYLIYSLSTSYRRGRHSEDLDFFATEISYGLHPRLDVSLSFPYANSRFEDLRVRSVGDLYVGAKFVALKPESGLGVAFAPRLEVLGKPSIFRNDFAPPRVNAILPIILQRNFERFRLYSEAGYITRGTLFLSTAADWTFRERWGAAVIVSGSRAVRHEELNREFNYNVARWDALVGLYYRDNDRFVVFANGGRTISRFDINSALYQVTIGFTVTQKIH